MKDQESGVSLLSSEPPGDGWKRSYDPGFAELTGPIWTKEIDGQPIFAFRAEQKHTNRHGLVHGGMMMTFLDQALGITASQASGPAGKVTIQMTVQFVGSARPGDLVIAKCELVKGTRSLIFMRGMACCGDRILASAEGIWKIISKPRGGDGDGARPGEEETSPSRT